MTSAVKISREGSVAWEPARLGVSGLDRLVCALVDRGVAASTLKAYAAGKRRYLSFCAQFGLQPLPVSEVLLLRFVAHLVQLGLAPPSIRLYLSAVRHMQITEGMSDPALASTPRLNYALRGLKRAYGGRGRQSRLPITPDILLRILQVWSHSTPSYDRVMLWAAFCVGFFGFMRSGEFTCPSWNEFTEDMLSPRDVAVDSRTSPAYVAVTLRRSKNDSFAVGTTLFLGTTGHPLCPVAALLGYLAIRPLGHGPLFLFESGSPLSKPRLAIVLRKALVDIGVDPSRFSGHSFRIGAATTAAKMGMSDSLIQTLGRWRSAAFVRYIRTPGEQLASISPKLLQ